MMDTSRDVDASSPATKLDVEIKGVETHRISGRLYPEFHNPCMLAETRLLAFDCAVARSSSIG